MKHTLILVGGIGGYRAYLDVPREEAEQRYWADKADVKVPEGRDPVLSARIKTIEFDEEFGLIDAWEVEPSE